MPKSIRKKRVWYANGWNAPDDGIARTTKLESNRIQTERTQTETARNCVGEQGIVNDQIQKLPAGDCMPTACTLQSLNTAIKTHMHPMGHDRLQRQENEPNQPQPDRTETQRLTSGNMCSEGQPGGCALGGAPVRTTVPQDTTMYVVPAAICPSPRAKGRENTRGHGERCWR